MGISAAAPAIPGQRALARWWYSRRTGDRRQTFPGWISSFAAALAWGSEAPKRWAKVSPPIEVIARWRYFGDPCFDAATSRSRPLMRRTTPRAELGWGVGARTSGPSGRSRTISLLRRALRDEALLVWARGTGSSRSITPASAGAHAKRNYSWVMKDGAWRIIC